MLVWIHGLEDDTEYTNNGTSIVGLNPRRCILIMEPECSLAYSLIIIVGSCTLSGDQRIVIGQV